MEETKKSIAILKARYPELCLIVGLNVLVMVSMNMIHGKSESQGFARSLPLLFIVFVVSILSIILNFGFQRSIYLHGTEHQSPVTLLKIGKDFFWRMISVGIVITMFSFAITWLIYRVTGPFTAGDIGFFETAKEMPLLYHFYFAVASLILIKPILLLGVLIIVLNCRVGQAVQALKHFRLSAHKELIVIYCLFTSLSLFWILLGSNAQTLSVRQSVLDCIQTMVSQITNMIVAIMAIRFVASVQLAYNDPEEQTEPQA
ncbi:hypothetical protein ACFL3G_12205 [Planctomycetota bacterium]